VSRFSSLLCSLALTLLTSTASAQIGSEWNSIHTYEPSAESFTVELRIGAYRPDMEPAFTTAFGGDLGPLLALELDYHLFRIPYLGPVAVGASVGWVEWSGTARTVAGGATNVGQTALNMVPLALLAVLRIDALARYLDVPLVLSGKIGPDFAYYQTGVTGRTDAEGWAYGLRWGAQIALELDFLEQRAANRLDQEWGINHSLVFFELFGSTLGQMGGNTLPLGTALAWTAGLELTF
jgi:hypothetical protein